MRLIPCSSRSAFKVLNTTLLGLLCTPLATDRGQARSLQSTMSIYSTHQDELLLRELRNKHDQVDHGVAAPFRVTSDSNCSSHSILEPTGFQPDHRVTLDVGGCVYSTSLDTLCCVEGSRFSDMLRDVTRTHAGWQLYIDRNGQMFGFILDYLRATSTGFGSLAPLPSAKHASALLAEARFYQLPGLVTKLQRAAEACSEKLEQIGVRHSTPSALELANAYAVIKGSKPEFSKAQMEELTRQINQQTLALQKKGFKLKDMSSGMTHDAGSTGGAYSLHINVLMAARTSAQHDIARANTVPSLKRPPGSQVARHSPRSKAPDTDAAVDLASTPKDPLPGLKQRLRSTTVQTSLAQPASDMQQNPQAQLSAFDPVTPPPEPFQHRFARIQTPGSPHFPQHTSGRHLSQPSGGRFLPSETLDALHTESTDLRHDTFSQKLSTTAGLLDSDAADTPPSQQWDASHMFQIHNSLASSQAESDAPHCCTFTDGTSSILGTTAIEDSCNQTAVIRFGSSSEGSDDNSQSHGCNTSAGFDEQLQSNVKQHQAFDDLFDTRQSSFLTTWHAGSNMSAQMEADALQGTAIASYQRLESSAPEPQPGPDILGSLPSMSGSATALSCQQGKQAEHNSDSVRTTPASRCQTPCLASSSQGLPAQVGLDPTGADQTEHENGVAAQDLALGARIVSTSHLEIMGWDLFADTLGTFHLLSDSASEPTSQSLPEPSDFGPVTPAAGADEATCPTHRLTAATSFAHARPTVNVSDSQDLDAFDVPFMEDFLPDTNPQMDDLVNRVLEAEHGSGFYRHNRHAYVVLESPRASASSQEASTLAEGQTIIADDQQRHYVCGCYRSSQTRSNKPRTTLRKQWATFCAKSKGCLRPTTVQEHAI